MNLIKIICQAGLVTSLVGSLSCASVAGTISVSTVFSNIGGLPASATFTINHEYDDTALTTASNYQGIPSSVATPTSLSFILQGSGVPAADGAWQFNAGSSFQTIWLNGSSDEVVFLSDTNGDYTRLTKTGLSDVLALGWETDISPTPLNVPIGTAPTAADFPAGVLLDSNNLSSHTLLSQISDAISVNGVPFTGLVVTQTVPEPNSLLLFGSGIVGLCLLTLRRRRRGE